MFTEKFDYLYVEPSTYCNLQCPRCPRTYRKDDFSLQHLSLDIFENLLASSLWNKVKTIEYGGNYGDPMMHPALDELINIARARHPMVEQIIHTSGNQSPKVWQKVCSNLTSRDSVLFSIDGLKDTNAIYRQGSRWDWIESALQSCSESYQTMWKFIVFRHNQQQIWPAIETAKSFGVRYFILTLSHLFYGEWENSNGDDPLAPEPQWIAKSSSYADKIHPRCQSSSMHYLAASGEYSPCCWSNRTSSLRWPIDDHTVSFDGLMQHTSLNDLKLSWGQSPLDICKRKCRQSLDSRSSHQQLTLDLQDSLDDLKNQMDQFQKLHQIS